MEIWHLLCPLVLSQSLDRVLLWGAYLKLKEIVRSVIEKGDSASLGFFLETVKGIEFHAQRELKSFILSVAIQEAKFECVELALSHQARVLPLYEPRESALQLAARHGQPQIAFELLKNGDPINQKTAIGTAVQWAALHGNLYMVKFLLDEGANPWGPETLHQVLDHKWLSKYSILATNSRECEESIQLLKEIICSLVEKDKNLVQCVDQNLMTPLHVASEKGISPIVNLLLKKGADINALDQTGRSPFDIAVRKLNIEFADLLIENGAKVDVTDLHGTPLMMGMFLARKIYMTELNDSGCWRNEPSKTAQVPPKNSCETQSPVLWILRRFFDSGRGIHKTFDDSMVQTCCQPLSSDCDSKAGLLDSISYSTSSYQTTSGGPWELGICG